MAKRKQTPGVSTRLAGQLAVVKLGHKPIWEGTDLALVRDVLRQLIEQESHSSVDIDLTAVEYLPSGFFGQLMHWHDRGVSLHIVGPHERVQNMLWFQRFFVLDVGDRYRLASAEVALGLEGEESEQSDRQLMSAISA